MTTNTGDSRRKRALYWLAIVGSAVALHILLFVGVRQSFFEVFRKSIDENAGASSPSASYPDAIVAIVIDVDGEEPTAAEVVERTVPIPPRPGDAEPRPGRGDDPLADIDVLDITGEAQAPLPAERSGRSTAIPPRPVEIMWPRTRGLGHCLGLSIDIRIEVGAAGEVLGVEPHDSRHPSDCTEAALEAARRIKFVPGRVKGKPARMWTRVRIDFRRKN